jgi:hypothetical protein
MTRAQIIRFPARKAAAIFVTEAREGGVVVMAVEHCWLHGNSSGAFEDAEWLSKNLGMPIRVVP